MELLTRKWARKLPNLSLKLKIQAEEARQERSTTESETKLLNINLFLMSFLANCGKAQIYKTDGTGRDTYIYNNSGGFCNDKEVAKVAQLGKPFAFLFSH